MARIVGIDLGTTNSVVAYLAGGKPEVIRSEKVGNLVPSVVAFRQESGERLIGEDAKREAPINPKNTASSVKRLIGRKFGDSEIAKIAQLLTFDLSESSNGDVHVELGGNKYSPPEISAMIIQQLKANAEAHFGEAVEQAVITVPAYFDNVQRQATIDAGKIAGLDVLRIINEPTAASLAYGLGEGKEGTVAVFDIGGGTFDISIVELCNGVFEVKATNGDTYLGGDNFDEAIVNWVIDEFRSKHGIDLRGDPSALQRIIEAAEQAKKELSTQFNTEILLPFITADATGPKNINMSISRAKLENMTDELVRRTIMPCQNALEDAGITADDIDAVLLVGGMTRMPAIQEVVKEVFGKEPERNVNPDEAVAIGAAIQSGILDGVVKDIVLLDVTPLTLSTVLQGGIARSMIRRNTSIPTKANGIFTTVEDNQTIIRVEVVQGEFKMAASNTSLGAFDLDGILPANRGEPQIEQTFQIDANGVLNVSAKDLGTGNEQSIVIRPSSGLSDAEIESAISEAERFAEEDKAKRALAEIKNNAEQTIYRSERIIREHRNKLKDGAVRKTKELIEALRKLESSNDADAIRSATEALLKQTYKLSGQLYAN